MNSVIHFEMPYEDKQRSADFYAQAFGWKAQMMGPDMGDYVIVTTTPVDEQTQRPKEPGAINGGLFKKSDKNNQTVLTVGVEDIHVAMKKVEEAGGKVIGSSKPGEPDPIPGVGLYISVEDTEGNKISLLQPDGNMEVRPQ